MRWKAILGLLMAVMAYASAAEAQAPGLERVLSAATLSFSQDGGADRAVLADNLDGGADLYLFLKTDGAKGPIKPALVKKNAAWSGAMRGTRPSLAVSDKGSLLVKSENAGVGRSRWSQTLTIAYRNGEFVVAGVTREARDTLDLKAGGSCDLNLLTGRGKRNGKAVETKFPATKLADWSDEKLPAECSF